MRQRTQHGQNLLETALVLPLFLLILAGIVDVGRAFNTFMVLSNMTREGARVAARSPCYTGTTAKAATQRMAYRAAIIQAMTDEITDASGTERSIDPADLVITLTPDPFDDNCPARGEPLRVAVAYPYQTFMNGVPLLGGGSFGLGTLTLRTATDMAIYTQRE
jgi:Flp pilus assembly protein TadG